MKKISENNCVNLLTRPGSGVYDAYKYKSEAEEKYFGQRH